VRTKDEKGEPHSFSLSFIYRHLATPNIRGCEMGCGSACMAGHRACAPTGPLILFIPGDLPLIPPSSLPPHAHTQTHTHLHPTLPPTHPRAPTHTQAAPLAGFTSSPSAARRARTRSTESTSTTRRGGGAVRSRVSCAASTRCRLRRCLAAALLPAILHAPLSFRLAALLPRPAACSCPAAAWLPVHAAISN
jgi:hypothetical protein